MRTDRVEFLGVMFDPKSFGDVLAHLRGVGADAPYSYVVTPNVDHVVRLNRAGEDPGLADVYANAGLCVCDSRVLSRIARLHRIDLPVVPGSDLTAAMLSQVVEAGDRIAVVGGDGTMMADLRRRFPRFEFVHHAPPMGLLHNRDAIGKAAHWLAAAKARFALIAVGTPQSEMIAAAAARINGATGTALCIGASLDFITGRQTRAPQWMQRHSLEWAYRLLTQPRRMWRRYLVEGPKVFMLAARYRNAGQAAPS